VKQRRNNGEPVVAVTATTAVQGGKTMNKFMRRMATAGISAVLVGGALLSAGGPATAATPQADQRIKVADGVRAVAFHDANHHRDRERYESASESRNLREYVSRNNGYRHVGERRGAHNRPDPWVAGQLAMFDPWITDQFAMFLPLDNPDQWVRRLGTPATQPETR
jgi:hypothetical protein